MADPTTGGAVTRPTDTTGLERGPSGAKKSDESGSAHGAVKKFRERRNKRRAKRARSAKREQDKRDRADAQQEEALQSARDVKASIPTATALNSILDARQAQGSAGSQVTQDAAGLAAQRRAMGMQEQIANQGYTAEDDATMQSANRAANLNEAAQRGAIMQNAAQRGQSRGGLAMMQALQAQQEGANRSADQAAQVGQNRIQARQAGVQNLAQQGSQIAQQGFAQSQARAGATDAFNDAMTQNRMQVPQQTFNNQLAASQNFQGQATSGAAYNQQTADAERQRRLAALSALTMGNMQ